MRRGPGVAFMMCRFDNPVVGWNYARHHQYAALPDASEAGAQAIAWLPLGTYGDRAFVMIFAVLRPEARWSARQRELFEAAANVMRQASVSARTDLLTGLGNRRASLEDAEAPSGQLGVVDVDGLKGVNDTQGHAAGFPEAGASFGAAHWPGALAGRRRGSRGGPATGRPPAVRAEAVAHTLTLTLLPGPGASPWLDALSTHS